MRLIDADELPIRSIDITDLPYDGKGLMAVLKEDIDNAPTVDRQAINAEWLKVGIEYAETHRPQGKWVRTGSMTKRSYQRMCNNCHNIVYFCGEGNYPNCPYCLADMRGGAE